MIDHIQICNDQLITYELVCVNLHVSIRMISDSTCALSLWKRVRAMGKAMWRNGVSRDEEIKAIGG
jgi:hypothetical protein